MGCPGSKTKTLLADGGEILDEMLNFVFSFQLPQTDESSGICTHVFLGLTGNFIVSASIAYKMFFFRLLFAIMD